MAVTEAKNTHFLHKPAILLLLFLSISLILNWPILNSGYHIDDILIYNAVHTNPLPYSRWLGVWSSMDMSHFENIWWKDEGVDVGFFRPIPSVIIEISMRLFGKKAFPLHLLSILLHGAVSYGLYVFVRKLAGSNWLALLAGLIFIMCDDHSPTVGWVSTITDIFCVFFIMISLNFHIDWLRERRVSSLAWMVIAMVLSMGCKETGVTAPFAIILLSLIMPRGSDISDFTWREFRGKLPGIFSDRLTWLSSVVMLVVYTVGYRAMGFGGMDSLLYTNPVTDPGRYLSHMFVHMPVLWLGTFTPMMIFLYVLIPELLKPMAIAGAAVFVLWIVALLPFKNRAIIDWSFATYMIALLPQVCTDAGTRCLYFPMIPASIMIAAVVAIIGPLAKKIFPVSSKFPWFTKFMGWFAVIGLILPSLLLSLAGPPMMADGLSQPYRDFVTAAPYIEEREYKHVVFLNARSFLQCIYATDYMRYITGKEDDIRLLSAASGIFTLEKTGENSFVIRTDRPGWIGNFVAGVMRTSPLLAPDRVYEKRLFDATLQELTEDNRDALAVRFDFRMPLSSRDILFLRWNGDTFEPLDISAIPVGDIVELADTSDIWASD